jgi:hypothetical protein
MTLPVFSLLLEIAGPEAAASAGWYWRLGRPDRDRVNRATMIVAEHRYDKAVAELRAPEARAVLAEIASVPPAPGACPLEQAARELRGQAAWRQSRPSIEVSSAGS